MSYSHFTLEEREKLSILKAKEFSNGEIATILNKDKSAIGRELKRNSTELSKEYFPNHANGKAKERRSSCKERFKAVNEGMLKEIKEGLSQFHSPDQVVGRMEREGKRVCSHETIYQMIYQNHLGMGEHSKYLRRERKKRRRRNPNGKKRSIIPNRVGIEKRPEIKEIGNWEGDTVIGKNHKGAIATFVDKVSKYLVAQLMDDKMSQSMNRVCREIFKNIPFRKTFTFDNGLEFAGHQEISRELETECYFANPYHSWERGLNEQTNGFLRQFIPKKTDFTQITEEELQEAVKLINSRPRKSLDYMTPEEVYLKELKRLEESKRNIIEYLPVALQI